MKFNIIADSSCDLSNDYITEDNIRLSIIPLTINVGEKSFIDNENLDITEMLTEMHNYSSKSTSSCPAPGLFMEAYEDADYSFVVTISKKLSGTYNSALLTAKDNSNIHVIDSKATSGSMILIIDELVRLIKTGKSFEEIKTEIDAYVENITLFFVLDKFENLVKNGRMGKLTSLFATILRIKPLCEANEGEIKIKEKPRTRMAALKRLVDNIKEKCTDIKNRVCIISHCFCKNDADELKVMIENEYDFKEIRVIETRGLCSFYALEGGLLVAF